MAKQDNSVTEKENIVTAYGSGSEGEVIIDVRFYPTGRVNTINQRPLDLEPQDWFDRLCKKFPADYRPLAGGRGTFRIASDRFTAMLQENAA